MSCFHIKPQFTGPNYAIIARLTAQNSFRVDFDRGRHPEQQAKTQRGLGSNETRFRDFFVWLRMYPTAEPRKKEDWRRTSTAVTAHIRGWIERIAACRNLKYDHRIYGRDLTIAV